MSRSRSKRILVPFNVGPASYRHACLDLKKAQLAVLQSKIQPNAPEWSIASISNEVLRARCAVETYLIQKEDSELNAIKPREATGVNLLQLTESVSSL